MIRRGQEEERRFLGGPGESACLGGAVDLAPRPLPLFLVSGSESRRAMRWTKLLGAPGVDRVLGLPQAGRSFFFPPSRKGMS